MGEFFAKDAIEDGGFAGGNTADETDIDVVNRDRDRVHFIGFCYFVVFERVSDRESIFCVKKRGFLQQNHDNIYTMNVKYPVDAAAAKTQIEDTLMLREVPKHRKVTDHTRKNEESDAWSFEEDPRWLFFKSPQNRDKQYYVLVRGGVGKDPRFDNTLEYLGNFDKIVERNLWGSNLRDAYRHYTIWFNRPMTSWIYETDELYYSTHDEERNARRSRSQEMEKAEKEESRRLKEVLKRENESRKPTNIYQKIDDEEEKKYRKSIQRNARRSRRQEIEKAEEEESRRLKEVLEREDKNRMSKHVHNQHEDEDEDEADRQIHATFNFMDIKNLGIIDVKMLKTALLAIGFEVHKDDIRRLYYYNNKNVNDSNITLDEYRKMVYSLWEEVSLTGPKKFSSKEKQDESSRLMREVLQYEDWRKQHNNEKKENVDDSSDDNDDREVKIRIPTSNYGEFRKDVESTGTFDPTQPVFHNTNFTPVPLSNANDISRDTQSSYVFDPTKPLFNNTNFTPVPSSKSNASPMKPRNSSKGGRRNYKKKTKKYFKKNKGTKRNLKYKRRQ